MYSIQHYVISLSVTCGRSVVFSGYSVTNKTDRQEITEILLKVALNIINHINRWGYFELYTEIKFGLLLYFQYATCLGKKKTKYECSIVNLNLCTFELYKSQNCTFTLLPILYMLKKKNRRLLN